MIVDVINCFQIAASSGFGSHRYWRIFISQNAGNATTTEIQEIEYHSTVGGSDITGSGTAMSGGSGTDGNPASNAYDNGVASWARSSATNTWIGYDFGSAVTVSEFAIKSANTGGHFTSAPQSFTLDYSDDGSSWTTATGGTFTIYGWLDNTLRTFPETATAGFHRFWRLFCTNNNGGTTFVGIGELEFRATVGGADQTASLGSNNGGSSGRIVGSSIGNAGNEGFHAFDNNTTNWWAATGTTNQWVGFVFPTPVTMLEAMVQAVNNGSQLTRQVKDGLIDWSDDGTSWTTAGTFSKTGWTAAEQITVTVTP